MRVLVVAATAMEVAPLTASLGSSKAIGPGVTGYAGRLRHDVDVLVTGVGMVAAAAWTSRTLAERSYDVALNVGVCGAFDAALAPGSVVHVVSDRIAELGAEDGDAFLPIDELGLPADPLGGVTSCVQAVAPASVALQRLPTVTGITVNTVHGSERSIAAIVERLRPQVESMEGAGFMYACATRGLRFAQVRAVSNRVERRNRAAWQLHEAIAALAPVVRQILETL